MTRATMTRACWLTIPLTLALLAASPASADPYFAIGDGTGTSWTQAIQNGNVRAATNLTSAAEAFYSQAVGQPIPGTDLILSGFQAVTPTLTPDVRVPDASGQSFDSLVMSWDPPADQTVLGVSSWDYVYDQDPDLSGTLICFSIFAPQGVWDLSLELIDENGNSRGWFRGMPPTDWQVFCIRPDQLGPQGVFDFFYTDDDFDITRVVAIRLNESGIRSIPFPIPDPTGNGINWNAWNSLSVVPEPSSVLLSSLGAGALGLITRRRRSRR